jgi:multidrug resistance protein MdtO
MAPRVLDAPRGAAIVLARLLRPIPGRLGFAARLALICALVTLVVEIYQTPDPALTVYLAFFLNKPDRAASLATSAAALVMISLVVGLVILVAMIVIDQPQWRVASMTAISVGFLFLASASKLRPVGATLAMVVAYALTLLGTVHGGEIVTRALLYAWLFVGIPAAVSICVDLLIAPAPHRLCERTVVRRLRLASALLRNGGEDVRDEVDECLRDGDDEIRKWLKLARLERSAAPERIEALERAAGASLMALASIRLLDQSGVTLASAIRDRAAAALEAMADGVQSGVRPDEIALGIETGAEPLAEPAAEIFECVREALGACAGAPSSAAERQGAEDTPAAHGFFRPDAFENAEHVDYALKTTAAAMLCYILYTLLDWPTIHTCFITCYVVSLGTTAETIEKLTLRIVGCLIGAAFGLATIIYVIPTITSIEELMALVFLGAFASAWVAASGPRVSYAGFQIAFAFFLCVVQGSGPSFDMLTARDRVIGVLLGNVVVYLVFAHVRPVSVEKRVESAFARLFGIMSAMLSAPDRSARCLQATQALMMSRRIEADLKLAAFEPARALGTEDWAKARRAAISAIESLLPSLFTVAKDDRALAAVLADRLRLLAERANSRTSSSLSSDDGFASRATPEERHKSRETIEHQLNRIERVFCVEKSDHTDVPA